MGVTEVWIEFAAAAALIGAAGTALTRSADVIAAKTGMSRSWVGLIMLAIPFSALAEEYSPSLTIKGHRFEPAELVVPANVKFKLVVKNQDPTPEEFESYELKREKIIRGNSELTLYIGPLAPGSYPFFGDFHQDTARGRLIAK